MKPDDESEIGNMVKGMIRSQMPKPKPKPEQKQPPPREQDHVRG